MKNKTDLMPNVESKPALGSDWVDANADYLFNFAIGQVRDTNTAEDLVQETFLAAVKAQASFGGKSSERTWLELRSVNCRRASHKCFNFTKSKSVRTAKSATK